MPNLKQLTKEQVPLLVRGDKLVLGTKVGAPIKRELSEEGLRHGMSYTFADYRPVYKSGEASILGYLIHLEESRHQVDIPYEFFVIGADLEGQLATRRTEKSI